MRYYQDQKVVYHNDSGAPDNAAYFKGMLNSIKNHIEAVRKDLIEIRLVDHSAGQHGKNKPDQRGHRTDLADSTQVLGAKSRSGWCAHLGRPMTVGGDRRITCAKSVPQTGRGCSRGERRQPPARMTYRAKDGAIVTTLRARLRSVARVAGRSSPHSAGAGRQPIGMIGLNGNRPSSQMWGWSIPAAYRFKSQPHRGRPSNLQIAINLQRTPAPLPPFHVPQLDFAVI